MYRSALRREPEYQELSDASVGVGINLAAIDVARILTICRPTDRSLLVQYMHGLTLREIARRLDITETAVRIRLFRARRAARAGVEKGCNRVSADVAERRSAA
jgi:DNA-directed RNA polymerase specialized sigma24 family protein